MTKIANNVNLRNFKKISQAARLTLLTKKLLRRLKQDHPDIKEIIELIYDTEKGKNYAIFDKGGNVYKIAFNVAPDRDFILADYATELIIAGLRPGSRQKNILHYLLGCVKTNSGDKCRAKDPASCTHPNCPNGVEAAYENAVDENVLNFIDKVRSDRNKFIAPLEVTQIGDTQAEAMHELNGVDYTGHTICLTKDAVTHIDNKHGKNGMADKSMTDDEDLARIGWVIDNFDDVELARKKSRQYKNRDGTRADIFIFNKRINGFYYVANAAPSTDRKQMVIITAYRSKA